MDNKKEYLNFKDEDDEERDMEIGKKLDAIDLELTSSKNQSEKKSNIVYE